MIRFQIPGEILCSYRKILCCGFLLLLESALFGSPGDLLRVIAFPGRTVGIPSVSPDGRLIVTTFPSDQEWGGHWLHSVDLKGNLNWTRHLNGFPMTPIISYDQKRIIHSYSLGRFGYGHGLLHVLDINGEDQWGKNSPGALGFRRTNPIQPCATSNNHIVVGYVTDFYLSGVYKLDLSGQTLWQSQDNYTASPRWIAIGSGGKMFLLKSPGLIIFNSDGSRQQSHMS